MDKKPYTCPSLQTDNPVLAMLCEIFLHSCLTFKKFLNFYWFVKDYPVCLLLIYVVSSKTALMSLFSRISCASTDYFTNW